MTKQGESLDKSTLASAFVFMINQGGKGMTVNVPSTNHQYGFILQNRKNVCNLRLASRKKGSTTYSNTITFIESEPVPVYQYVE